MMKTFLPCLLLAAIISFCSQSSMLAQGATLRAGDRVEIRLGGVPSEDTGTVSGSYTIDPEGYINLPHIGKVRAAGLEQHDLQQTIENRYKSEQIYTRPTVTINQQMGDRFVNVDGEVRSRQRVSFTPDMTLMTAINAAGGLSEYADQKRVQLTRDGQAQTIDIRQIRRGAQEDIPVIPGDAIFVPRSFW